MYTQFPTPPSVLSAQDTLKKYQKPVIQVITLDQQPPLLAQSGGLGSQRKGYPKQTPETW